MLGETWVGGVQNASYIVLAKVVSTVVPFLIVTALFGAIYKYLPAIRIAWHDVLRGALVTSILFLAGKLLIALYLGTTNFTSGYGAAGPLVLPVSWIYCSAQIFFMARCLPTNMRSTAAGQSKRQYRHHRHSLRQLESSVVGVYIMHVAAVDCRSAVERADCAIRPPSHEHAAGSHCCNQGLCRPDTWATCP